MPLTEQHMHQIGELRRQLAEANDLRLVTVLGATGVRGTMHGSGPSGRAAADAYNFLASLQAQHSTNAKA